MAHKYHPETTTYTCDICGKRMSAPFDVPFDHRYSYINILKGNNTPKLFKLNLFDMDRYSDENIKEAAEWKCISHYRHAEVCPRCVSKKIEHTIETNVANKPMIATALDWLKSFLSTISQEEYLKHKEYLPIEFTTIVDAYYEYKGEQANG